MNRRNILKGMIGGLGAWVLGKSVKAAPVEPETMANISGRVDDISATAKPELVRVTEDLGYGVYNGNVVRMSDTQPLLHAMPGTIKISERGGSEIPVGSILLGHPSEQCSGFYWVSYDLV